MRIPLSLPYIVKWYHRIFKEIENPILREPTKEETEKKRIDALIRTANGHEDNPSVQAARRVLDKRGIDWQKKDGQINTQTEENHAHNSEEIMREQKNVQLQQTTTTLTNDRHPGKAESHGSRTHCPKQGGNRGSTGNRRTGAGNAW